MNLFVIMMLLNMALVWLMMYFSICLMIIISICSMTIVLKWYFEITIIPSKKDCADRPFEIIFFSILGQHNLWKQFLMFLVLKWYMTVISKWGDKIFVHKIVFVRKNQIFYWRKCIYYYYFRTQLFTQGIVSLSLRWNKFLRKETVCYVRF